MRTVFLGLSMLVLVSAPAPGEIYKSTDPSGRIIYSDKPQPGAATARPATPSVSADGADNTFRELEGAWRVANVTMNGALQLNDKDTGATWFFAKNELTIERSNGEKARYAVRIEPGAKPKAFALTPVSPATERGGVMIYARDGERLRLAFMDNLGGRPSGFEPQPKQVVVTLLAQGGAESGKRSATAARPACEILRAAGVADLIGPNPESRTRGNSDPAAQCELLQPTGTVALVLMPAAERSALDTEREQQQKQARTRAVSTLKA